ncbi:MAG: type IV secretion system protein [Phormidesmis sp. CAN_BIN36]|nr:type IV secretion system protein [Phormidesmis sp. CAN_BIN36]
MTRDRGIPKRRLPNSSKSQNSGRPFDLPFPPSSLPSQPPDTIADTQSASEFQSSKAHLKKRLGRVLTDWRLAAGLGLALTGGLSFLAIGFLFKLPAVPNCPAIFWPLASASLRVHCAQLAANKQTVNDLLEAIKLLNSLPNDHPLYQEASRLIEQWSKEILQLGDEAFNAGKLSEAIDIARKVPRSASVYGEVEGRISRWQSIWSEAEAIYRRVEDALRGQNWRKASSDAARLLSVENNFWQTTKYQELTEKITLTRADISKIAKAKDLADRGGVSNLIEAIKLASKVSDQSYVYQEAQDTIAQFGRKMLDLAQDTLTRRDLQGALDIVSKIPPIAKLQREAEDFEVIANAQAKAWGGTVADIEAAIAQIQKVEIGRPLYAKAQTLLGRWQSEKGDIAQIEKARQLAQSGKPKDLEAAIAQASLVPSDNPRSQEAQKLADDLSRQMQTQQDRPLLDQADQFASRGDIASLQTAMDQANQVTSGRALYKEAQNRIKQWNRQLAQLQDEPILSQADSLAESGDLSSAIAAAQSVNSSSAIYGEAQSKVQTWRRRQQAEQGLQQARTAANGGTLDSLAEAIRLANGVPGTSPLRGEATQAIEQWSQQILQAAISQADTDVAGAIVTAQKIPPRTEAYAPAQLQIEAWKRIIGR